MINLYNMIVDGYCDTSEELKEYLKNLKLLPAKIMSVVTQPGTGIMMNKIMFEIEYQPLIKI